MSDKIKPALTAEEWAAIRDFHRQCDDGGIPRGGLMVRVGDRSTVLPPEAMPGLIAQANDALPDSDPRKISRERTERIRAIGEAIRERMDNVDAKEFLRELADTLESYLPPEQP